MLTLLLVLVHCFFLASSVLATEMTTAPLPKQFSSKIFQDIVNNDLDIREAWSKYKIPLKNDAVRRHFEAKGQLSLKWALGEHYLDEKFWRFLLGFGSVVFNDYSAPKLVLHDVALNGTLPLLKLMHKHLNQGFPRHGMAGAALGGHLDMMKWIANKEDEEWSTSFSALQAAIYNQIMPFRFNADIFSYAARGGNLDCMRWLKKMRCPWDERTFLGAAEVGIKYNMIWLKVHECPWNAQTFTVTVKQRNFANMVWLHYKKCPCDEGAFTQAVYHGDIKLLGYLKDFKCPWNETTFSAAAEIANLKVMKWLRKSRCPWDNTTFSEAAKVGNLKIMKWLKGNKFTWDERTFTAAARIGNMEIMEWLFQNHFPWDTETYRSAKTEVRQWLKDHGCPMPAPTPAPRPDTLFTSISN